MSGFWAVPLQTSLYFVVFCSDILLFIFLFKLLHPQKTDELSGTELVELDYTLVRSPKVPHWLSGLIDHTWAIRSSG